MIIQVFFVLLSTKTILTYSKDLDSSYYDDKPHVPIKQPRNLHVMQKHIHKIAVCKLARGEDSLVQFQRLKLIKSLIADCKYSM